jgi:hypothetical protein
MPEVTKQQVDTAREEAEHAYTKYHLLKEAFLKAEKEYLDKVKKFKKLDYELAEIDGRLKKIPSASSKERKMQKQPELSLDQLKAIAERLGFDLSAGEIEDSEEVVEAVVE